MATQTQSPVVSQPTSRTPRDVRRTRRLFAAALLPVPAVAPLAAPPAEPPLDPPLPCANAAKG